MILDTSFLIDLERELRQGRLDGPASAVLASPSAAGTAPCVTETILGELASGESMARREIWDAFIAPYPVLAIDRETAWQYGCAFRALRRSGRMIGANDLWIAASALAHRLPVVTRNADEFRRVPGLKVIGY